MRSIAISLALLALVVAVPACDSGSYPTENQGQAQPTGPVTGILINAQMPNTKDTELAAGKSTTIWKVVDPAGNEIISSEQATGSKGVNFEFVAAKSREGKNLWLGANPREFRITNFEVVPNGTDDKGETTNTFKFVVSDATANEMRSLPNLMDLVRKSNIVVLTGKIGQ